MIRQHWAKTSLTVRLVVVFAVSALLLWVVLLSLVIVSALDNGKEGLEAELRTYARQILPAAIALADRPASLAKVITEVERLENQATGADVDQWSPHQP